MNRTEQSDANLVIFGCGYLGCALAEAAVKQGLRVHAVTRNPETARRLRRTGVAVFEGLLEDDAWHAAVPPAPAFAVNCVGSFDRTVDGYRRSYIDGMDSVARWATRGTPGVFVYTSSTGVYGEVSGNVDEETEPVSLSEKNRILLEVERMVADGSLGKRWFIVRLSGLYGPGRHRLLDRVRSGDPKLKEEVDRRLNIIHREDACQAVLDCLNAAPEVISQIFNVTSDVAANRREMIDWLAAYARLEPLATGRDKCPGINRERMVPDRVVSNRRIKELLGWRPCYPDFRSGYEAILAAE